MTSYELIEISILPGRVVSVVVLCGLMYVYSSTKCLLIKLVGQQIYCRPRDALAQTLSMRIDLTLAFTVAGGRYCRISNSNQCMPGQTASDSIYTASARNNHHCKRLLQPLLRSLQAANYSKQRQALDALHNHC